MDTVDITSKAAEYAGGKTVECLAKAIEQAYKDGYLDGFKDGKELARDCISTGEVNYVDLGLPSGTLWSDDYVKKEGEVYYWTYEEACEKSIPTEEQWKELQENCVWRFTREDKLRVAWCIGPNGKMLRFNGDGRLEGDVLKIPDAYFWVLSEVKEENKNYHTMARIKFYFEDRNAKLGSESCFVGFGLPLRLVKNRD